VTLDQDTRASIEAFLLSFREANKRPPSPSSFSSPKRIIFESAVFETTSVAIDYKAKSVAVKEIAVSPIELLNLVSVEGVYITLGALKLKNIAGWEALQLEAKEKWTPSLIQQAPLSYLQSIRYLRPLAAFGSGLKDLAVIPYESYRDSGSLTSAATSAVVSLTRKITQGATEGAARVTIGASTVFEGIEKAINIEGEKRTTEEKPSSRFANQPANVGEGLTKAYDALMRQLRESRENIVAIPLRHYQQHGTLGFVTALAKAVPLAVVKPIRGTTEAASQVFLGARNQMLPEEKKASDQKYYGGASDEKK
jgi:autophagy-related protein 2